MQQKYDQLISAIDSLMMDLEIRIKICLDVEKGRNWYEKSVKADYDLWIVKEGEICVAIDDEEYVLQKNDVILLEPKVMYSAHCKSEMCRFSFVHFDAAIGKNQRALEGLPLEGSVSSALIGKESQNFLECYEKYREGELFSALSIRGNFLLLLWKFLSVQLQKSIDQHSKSSEKNSIFRIYKVFGYIEANIATPICVDDLAEIAKMSPKYFITFFKNAVGISPAQYVLRYRMKKALEYIYEQKYSVKEVAAMVGYEDQYTFSKAFKKIYNCAPSNVIGTEFFEISGIDGLNPLS